MRDDALSADARALTVPAEILAECKQVRTEEQTREKNKGGPRLDWMHKRTGGGECRAGEHFRAAARCSRGRSHHRMLAAPACVGLPLSRRVASADTVARVCVDSCPAAPLCPAALLLVVVPDEILAKCKQVGTEEQTRGKTQEETATRLDAREVRRLRTPRGQALSRTGPQQARLASSMHVGSTCARWAAVPATGSNCRRLGEVTHRVAPKSAMSPCCLWPSSRRPVKFW